MPLHVQPAVVAGMFYPADAGELAFQVDTLLAAAGADTGNGETPPKALIAPHAGYVYSGPVAAHAYAALRGHAGRIRRVLVLAPSHRVPFRGLAVPSVDVFRTPLGDIRVDRDALEAIAALPGVVQLDRAFAAEHALEVHLPFLQRTLGDFLLVPIVVGDAEPGTVARVLEALWGGAETLIVVSSDLSHFHDYATAQAMDRRTCAAIEALRPDAIGYDDACGRNPVKGLLQAARQHALHARTLDLRNSGDTAGDRSRVVGYGAWLFA